MNKYSIFFDLLDKARGRLSRESSPERRVGSRDSSPERRVQSRHSSPERRVQSRDSSPERRVKSRESSPERRVQNREPSLRNRSQSPSSKSQLTYRSRYGRASHRRNTRIYKRSRSKSSSSSSSSSSSAASSSSTTPSTVRFDQISTDFSGLKIKYFYFFNNLEKQNQILLR